MTFYMTFEGPFQPQVLRVADEFNIGIMKNAFHRWSDYEGEFLPYNHLPDHAPLIIDSGGFNVLANDNTEFPWSVEQYHEFLQQYSDRFDWAACMDYACEHRFDDLMSKEERVEKTLENAIEHFNLDPEYNLRPVLQGRTLEDYVEFYDRLNDHGIPTDYVGLGTVCRLNSSSEIVEIERGLRRATDIEAIHGFGVKVAAFKLGAYFETADSRAWGDAPDHGEVYYNANQKLRRVPHNDDNSLRAVLRSFHEYYDYASGLKQEAASRRVEGKQSALAQFST